MRTDAEAQKRVAQMIRRENFPAVVHRLGVNRGLVYRVWKDGIHSPTVRRALGLPPKTVPVEPCADCGQVHTQHKQCSDERQTRTRHRVALEVDTPAEAAALRALLARHGSRRRIARALVTGELRIVEGGSE